MVINGYVIQIVSYGKHFDTSETPFSSLTNQHPTTGKVKSNWTDNSCVLFLSLLLLFVFVGMSWIRHVAVRTIQYKGLVVLYYENIFPISICSPFVVNTLLVSCIFMCQSWNALSSACSVVQTIQYKGLVILYSKNILSNNICSSYAHRHS